MNTMKRILTLALLAATTIGLGACAHKDDEASSRTSSTGTYQSSSTYAK